MCKTFNIEFLTLLFYLNFPSFTGSLFASTPAIKNALEIGRQAELYAYEQNISAALDRFTSALNILVPLLPQEPAGKRKELLQKQVMIFLKANSKENFEYNNN